MSGLIVGSPERGHCKTLRGQMESSGSPAKCRLDAYNLSIFLPYIVHDTAQVKCIHLSKLYYVSWLYFYKKNLTPWSNQNLLDMVNIPHTLGDIC